MRSAAQVRSQVYAIGANLGHGRFASATRAARRARALRRGGGRRPAGRPAARRTRSPTGMLTAGMPEMLNGAVYGTEPMPPTRWPAISNGGGPSATNAVVAVVGVSMRSTSSNTSAIAASNSSRRRMRAQDLVGRDVARCISNPAPRHRRDVVAAAARRRARRSGSRPSSVGEDRPRPARAAGGARRRRRARCPASAHERERGFVRELLDLGIAHREAERRRPRRALAAQLRDRVARQRPRPRTTGGRGSDVGSMSVGPAIAST